MEVSEILKFQKFFVVSFLQSDESSFAETHYHSIGIEENTSSTNLHRIIETEENDKEPMHLLIFLIMQFLSRSDLVSLSLLNLQTASLNLS